MTPEIPQDESIREHDVTPPETSDADVSVTPEKAAERPKQNPWKTAFIILTGILLLSGVMIYSTSVKRTDPTTALQTDANSQPVQPLNPASGAEEDRLALMPPDTAAVVTNTNSAAGAAPNQLPGGDGYNPWANGGAPPPGGPKVGPGGGYVTVPNGGSQFMPPDCILQPSGIYLCPVPVNANTAAKPTPAPKGTPLNANVQPSPSPGTGPKAIPTPVGAKPSTTRTPAKAAPVKSPELDQF